MVTKTSLPPNKTDEWVLTFPKLGTVYRAAYRPVGIHRFTMRLRTQVDPALTNKLRSW
jgi:hypothetical protein